MPRPLTYRTSHTQLQQQVTFINQSGEDIPPFAVMKIKKPATGISRAVIVDKPDNETEYAQLASLIMFNGGTTVRNKVAAYGFTCAPAKVVVEGDPAAGDTIGPAAGSWSMWRGGVTHVVESIYETPDRKFALLDHCVSPTTARIKTKPTGIPGLTGSTPGRAQVLLQMPTNPLRDVANDYELMPPGPLIDAVSIAGQQIEMYVEHDGTTAVSGSTRGQATLVAGRWLLSVEYCD